MDYVAGQEGVWKGAKTKDGWLRSIDSHAAQIKDDPIDEIDVEAVLKVLQPLWTTKAESAGKLRDRLERVTPPFTCPRRGQPLSSRRPENATSVNGSGFSGPM